MADAVRVTDAVEVTPDSEARVALELMRYIAGKEGDTTERTQRKYWLELYFQCRLATAGRVPLDRILSAVKAV